jgi:hypothetical protein
MGFDADAVEREDGGDAEPDGDDERDGAPLILPDLVLPKVIRHQAQAALDPGSGPLD